MPPDSKGHHDAVGFSQKGRGCPTWLVLLPSYFGSLTSLDVLLGQGQPALMWLVPCTLGIALLLGWRRGDLRGMWIGCNDEASLVEGKGETRLPSIQEDDLEQGESMPVRADLNHSLLNRGSSGSM